MRKRLIIIGSVCFLVICASYIWLSLNPIIIHKPYPQNTFGTSVDNSYNPINSMDFTHGKNKIVIYIDWKDIQFLPAKIKRWTLLECRDNSIIEAVKNNFVFERVSENFAETTDYDSRIFFFQNNTLVFTAKIQIESEVVSLYFCNTAWTFAVNSNELISLFRKFSPTYFPIIKVN